MSSIRAQMSDKNIQILYFFSVINQNLKIIYYAHYSSYNYTAWQLINYKLTN